MKIHTQIYLEKFGYDPMDFIPSEIYPHAKAVDIHHIECRGMGGNPSGDKDRIENLMALTRDQHNHYGDKKQYMKFLFQTHKDFMMRKGVEFDHEYMDQQIAKYD